MRSPTEQAALQGASDTSRSEVLAAADRAAQVLRDLNPDLSLELSDVDSDRWTDCSESFGDASEGPAFIQWLSDRTFYVEPTQPTEPLLDPFLAELARAGWASGMDSTSPTAEQRVVALSQGAMTAAVTGTTGSVAGMVSPVSVTIYGPCLAAPDGIDDGKPAAR